MPTFSGFSRAILWALCGAWSLSSAADVPRIVGLASAPETVATAPIREPASAAAMPSEQPPSEGRRRSEFVPIALPDPLPPIAASAVPQLAERPQFGLPAVAADSQASAGPLLVSPTAPPAMTARPPAEMEMLRETAGPEWKAGTTHPTDNQERKVGIAHPTGMQQGKVGTAHPTRKAAVNSAAMQAVVQRATQKADQAASMAQRGMLFSARAELVQGLQLIAHALDAQHGSASHSSALAAGLTAIEEARDFAGSATGPSEDYQVQAVAAGHRTRAIAEGEALPSSPIAVQQKYLSLAQGRFIEAAGGVPAAAQILYRLGRLETAMAAHDADPLALHGPQAIVFHQAALATDPANWLAANELGVLYARFGQLEAAKQLLLASVTAHPHGNGWQNLAAVHRRLGETELAQRAESERQLLAAKTAAVSAGAKSAVTWVDPKTFAARGAGDVSWPAEVANRAVRR